MEEFARSFLNKQMAKEEKSTFSVISCSGNARLNTRQSIDHAIAYDMYCAHVIVAPYNNLPAKTHDQNI